MESANSESRESRATKSTKEPPNNSHPPNTAVNILEASAVSQLTKLTQWHSPTSTPTRGSSINKLRVALQDLVYGGGPVVTT